MFNTFTNLPLENFDIIFKFKHVITRQNFVFSVVSTFNLS